MQRITIFAAICLGMWLPSASEANWQNTRWDMSLEDLLATRENLERTTPLEQRDQTIEILGMPLAKGEYSTQEYGFKVYFYFRRSKLTGVRLEAKEPEKAVNIFNDFKLTYGNPSESLNKSMSSDCRGLRGSWRDEQNGNAIMFAAYFCESARNQKLNTVRILYQPILRPGKSGL